MKKNTKSDTFTVRLNNYLKEFTGEPKILCFGRGENLFQVTVQPGLPLAKRAELVRQIAEMVLPAAAKMPEEYHPEYMDIAQRYSVLAFYTDFSLPNDLETLWALLKHTPVYEEVAKCIGGDLDELFRAAEELIETRKNALIYKSDIQAFLSKITDSVGEMLLRLSKLDMSEISKSLKDTLQQGESKDEVE